MKQLLPVFFLFCSTVFFGQTVFKDYADGRVYVKFSKSFLKPVAHENPDNLPLDKLGALTGVITKYGITRAYKPFYRAMDDQILPYILRLEFSDKSKVNALIDELHQINGVEYAEKVPLMKTDILPNDPIFPAHLTQVNAANAWNVFSGSSNITVAIVDNAVMWTHQDLVANTYTNTGEIAGNSIDDDGNGYVDDRNGYDVADNDNNAVPTNTLMDHGTHCAGIAGARTDNTVGIASIGWNIKIIPVKTEPDLGSVNAISFGYEGIVYAANANARVISCSWGGSGAAAAEQAVVNYAWNRGCIIVAAAGNANTTTQNYPGAYNNVYCVASVSSADVKSSFSNYGTWIDISAPGENVYSTTPSATTGTYLTFSGTSMATPLVAGLAGLMLSKCSFMTQTDVLNCISSTAVNIYTLAGNASYVTNSRLGAGRIEAFQAMNCAASFTNTPPVANFFTPTRNTCPQTPIVFYDSSLYLPTSWSWVFQGGTPATSTLTSPTVQWSAPGTYSVMLTVSNANGTDSETKLTYVTVAGPIALPLAEGFQAAAFLPANWTQNNILNDNIYWSRRTNLGGFATSTACAMFDNYNIDAIGERDEMRTPKYSFSNVATARLRFDVAYARYNSTFSDTLEVKVSTNCGTSWTSIYLKGGTLLSTTANDVSSGLFVPTSLQWRRDTIDISLLTAGQGNVMFSFINRGHYGQPIYLDNINLVFPTPTVNISNPANTCVGANFNFTNTSIGISSYSWSMPGGSPATSTSSNPSVSYPAAGVYTINLLMTNGTTTASTTRTVNVVTPPVVSVNTPTVCSGVAAVLTASGATTYSWNTGPSTASISVSPPATSYYTVTGNNSGCSVVKTATVYVNAAPVITVNSAYICSGGNAVLTPTGAISYTWTNGPTTNTIQASPAATSIYTVTGSNGNCNSTQTSTIFVTITPTVIVTSPTICAGTSTILIASGATNYNWVSGPLTNTYQVSPVNTATYVITGTNPGPGISCQNTKTVNVTVTPLPNVAITANTPTLCSGGSVTLTANGASSYSWSNGSATAVTVVSPTATTVYAVTGTSLNCNNVGALTLTVVPLPALIVASAPSNTVCSGLTTTLSATGNYTTINWASPSATATSILIINPTTNSVYTVIANGVNGCNTTGTLALTVLANPISTVATSNAGCNNFCSGSASVSASGGVAPYTYSLVNSACGFPCTNLCVGNYTLITTGGNACSSVNTFSILPSANNLVSAISFTNASCQTCADGSAAMIVSGGQGPYTFLWMPTSNTQASNSNLLAGCYTVTATDYIGCSITATTCIAANVTTVTGIGSNSFANKALLVYPNPAHDQVIVEYTGELFGYHLYNGLGQLIAQKQNNFDKTEINLTEFAKGIYVVEVNTGAATIRKKLVVE